MGTTLFNFHVKGADADQVQVALGDASDALPAYLTRANDRWVSVYPEEDHGIQHMAEAVSGALDATVIAFHVNDGEYCEYWLYEGGELADHHHTDPHLSDAEPSFGWAQEHADEDESDTTALLRHSEEASEDVIAAALGARWEHAEEAAVEIAGFLGIGPERAEFTYGLAHSGDPPPDDAGHIDG